MRDISTLIYCINTCSGRSASVSKTEPADVFDTIETVSMEPSETSLKNILNFARSYDVMETSSVGYVEMILN